VAPLKSHSSTEWLTSYDGVHQELKAKGCKPKLQTMDNEASAALKSYLTENDVYYQLVPSHIHKHNTAEKEIRIFKEHFVTGLVSVDPDFPMHLWDRVLS
jgi:hypothetical protein